MESSATFPLGIDPGPSVRSGQFQLGQVKFAWPELGPTIRIETVFTLPVDAELVKTKL